MAKKKKIVEKQLVEEKIQEQEVQEQVVNYKEVYTPKYFKTKVESLDGELNKGHFYNYALYLVQDFVFNTVLDVGCGFANMLSHLNNLGKKTTGVDVSEHVLEIAKQRVAGGEFICSQLPALSELGDRKFDIVVCYQVLEHLTERDALESIKRMYDLADKYLILSIYTDTIKNEVDNQDDTHILVKSRQWWLDKLSGYKIITDKDYNNSKKEIIIQK